ncbi:MAG: hypothetical protein V1659_04400 [Candidatus Woesearchaeota archaeon]
MEAFNSTAVNASLGVVDIAVKNINPVLNRLIIALIIALLAFILGKIAGEVFEWFLKRLNIDKHSSRIFDIRFAPSRVISRSISLAIYLAGIFLALNQIGIASLVVNILIGLVILTALVSFLISIFGAVPNIIAGFRLRKKLRLKKGAKIALMGVDGIIKELGFLEVIIDGQNREMIVVPYSVFYTTVSKIR